MFGVQRFCKPQVNGSSPFGGCFVSCRSGSHIVASCLVFKGFPSTGMVVTGRTVVAPDRMTWHGDAPQLLVYKLGVGCTIIRTCRAKIGPVLGVVRRT